MKWYFFSGKLPVEPIKKPYIPVYVLRSSEREWGIIKVGYLVRYSLPLFFDNMRAWHRLASTPY